MTEKYPLEQLVLIKQRRLEESERILKEKKEELEKEKERGKKLEAERDKTFEHRQDKLNQLREILDKGTTSDKIKVMREYIEVVNEELIQKEKRLQAQKKVIEEGEIAVEEARKDMLKKQQDVEKLKIHRKEWEKEMKLQMEHKEGIETDDLGTSMHTTRKRKR